MKKPTTPRIDKSARPGMTLVELIVAISIVVLLAGMVVAFYPGVQEGQRAAQGGTMFEGWLRLAKSRAIRDQRVRGLRLLLNNTTNPLFVTQCQLLDQPDDMYIQGYNVSLTGQKVTIASKGFTFIAGGGLIEGVAPPPGKPSYIPPPVISFPGGGTGTGAQANVTLNATNQIVSVPVTATGQNYPAPATSATVAPGFGGRGLYSVGDTFAVPGGAPTTPAVLSVASSTLNGVITAVTVNPTNSYTTPPPNLISPPNQNGITGAVFSLTITPNIDPMTKLITSYSVTNALVQFGGGYKTGDILAIQGVPGAANLIVTAVNGVAIGASVSGGSSTIYPTFPVSTTNLTNASAAGAKFNIFDTGGAIFGVDFYQGLSSNPALWQEQMSDPTLWAVQPGDYLEVNGTGQVHLIKNVQGNLGNQLLLQPIVNGLFYGTSTTSTGATTVTIAPTAGNTLGNLAVGCYLDIPFNLTPTVMDTVLIQSLAPAGPGFPAGSVVATVSGHVSGGHTSGSPSADAVLSHCITSTGMGTTFRIIRAPRVAGDEQMQLPAGIVIDLSQNSTYNNPLPFTPNPTNPTSLDILFSPSGTVITPGISTPFLALWVRDVNGNTPFQLGPTILAVWVRSGLIAAHPPNDVPTAGVPDPYKFVVDGRSQ